MNRGRAAGVDQGIWQGWGSYNGADGWHVICGSLESGHFEI
jgi:hypothetical protein